MKIVTAAQMQGLDRRTIEEARVPGLTLMERAGTGVVSVLGDTVGSPNGKTVAILCGKGNNGGDGFVVARLLRRKLARVRVLLLGKPKELTADAKTMYQRFLKLAGASAVLSNPSEESIRTALEKSDLIVDALLGTGISSHVKDQYRIAIDAMNASRAPIIAIDLPSGIHTDTGEILGTAVRANQTVTFGCPKLGLYLGPAIDCAGKIHTVDIGIPRSYVDALEVRTHLISHTMIRRLLPSRPTSSHKGTFGHVGIIAGSPGKTGAAALAAKAALRVGAGLVTVATPRSANHALEAKLLEAMTAPMPETEAGTLAPSALDQLRSFSNDRSAVAIGPGLTTHAETAELILALIVGLKRPFVLDADALNVLSGQTQLLRACKTLPIITPHPGEMARLLGQTTAQSINNDRLATALRFAIDHHVIVVLKGARTIIASPDGQIAICPTGNPGMATAGMGDTLTGIIVGLLAQRLGPWDAACSGAYLHGLAGDLIAQKLGEHGMIAGDLIDSIPYALTQTLQS